VSVNLESYSLNSVTEGIQAMAVTRVVISPGSKSGLSEVEGCKERKFTGLGSDTDIVCGSARAYTSALNKLLTYTMRRRKDTTITSEAVSVTTVAPTVVGADS